MAELRAAHPNVTFLVPGIGAQGGDLQATLAAGLDARGFGLLISASRSIIYARGGTALGIRAAAEELHAAINFERDKKRSIGRAKTRVS
jgi:orotidine-5'-phosphate decarboxylase